MAKFSHPHVFNPLLIGFLLEFFNDDLAHKNNMTLLPDRQKCNNMSIHLDTIPPLDRQIYFAITILHSSCIAWHTDACEKVNLFLKK